jgi:hypothetical protein
MRDSIHCIQQLHQLLIHEKIPIHLAARAFFAPFNDRNGSFEHGFAVCRDEKVFGAAFYEF